MGAMSASLERMEFFLTDPSGNAGLLSQWAKMASNVGTWQHFAHTGAQLSLGGPGTGAPMHWHSTAFNILVYGRKLWVLVQPKDAVFANTPAKHYLANEHEQWWAHNRDARRCVQQAGDLLMVP